MARAGHSNSIGRFLRLDEPRIRKRIIVQLCVIAAGVLTGAIAAGVLAYSGRETAQTLFDRLVGCYGEVSFGRLFGRSLLLSLSVAAACAATGGLYIGTVIRAALFFFWGTGLGCAAGVLCYFEQFSGFLFYLLALLPGALLSSIGVVCFVSLFLESRRFSTRAGSSAPELAAGAAIVLVLSVCAAFLDGILLRGLSALIM